MNAGECKTDPVSGIAGAIWAAWLADPDSGLAAVLAQLGSGSPLRRQLGSKTEAEAAVIASLLSTGSGSIGNGSTSVVIPDAAVTSSSKVFPTIEQATFDAAATTVQAVPSLGHVTIYCNAAVAGASLAVGYVAINA